VFVLALPARRMFLSVSTIIYDLWINVIMKLLKQGSVTARNDWILQVICFKILETFFVTCNNITTLYQNGSTMCNAMLFSLVYCT